MAEQAEMPRRNLFYCLAAIFCFVVVLEVMVDDATTFARSADPLRTYIHTHRQGKRASHECMLFTVNVVKITTKQALAGTSDGRNPREPFASSGIFIHAGVIGEVDQFDYT